MHSAAPEVALAGRWPPLLLTLRRLARPDRARVAAYSFLAGHPAAGLAYGQFLVAHRAWIAALDRVLDEAGVPSSSAHAQDDLAPDEAGPAGLAEAIPPAARTRAEALGYLYVREAFRLGCSALARRLRGTLGEAAPAVRPSAQPWRQLVRSLGQVPPEQHAEVLVGARQAFAAWSTWLGPSLQRLGLSGPDAPQVEAA
jgi:heme oxygenase